MSFNSKLRPLSAISVIIFAILTLNGIVCEANADAHNFTFIYRDYLRNMVAIMDHGMQPCENFFQHACGNFESFQKNESPNTYSEAPDEWLGGHNDVVPFLYNKQDYYTFFESHKQRFNTIPGILVSNLYDLCENSQPATVARLAVWRRMINELPFLKHDHDLLRKWPFLQYQWNKYEPQLDLSWPALAAEFSAYNLATIVNVFFAKDTIYVAPNDLLHCPDQSEMKANLLPLLGKRSAQIAEVIGNEIWLLCRQLKGEISLSQEIDAIKANPLQDDKISEFFQRLFTRLNFTDNEIENARKIVINEDKLSELMSLLCSTNPRIVYNFVLWQAYQQIASIDDCFELVQEFDSLLQVEFWNWYAFKPHFSRDLAMASFLFHTTRFQKFYRQFITSTSWIRLFEKRSERKDLNIERSIKNYAQQFLDLDKYVNSFKSETFANENLTFYAHLSELRRLKMRFTFLNPYEDTEDVQFYKEFLNFSILLLYRPRLHYFATYDREMWQNSKLLKNSDGLYSALDCLNQQTYLHSEESNVYEELNMDLINDIFDFYTAFNEALADYKFWLKSENFAIAEDFILEYFKLDSKSIMFYAVAQQFCNRNDRFYRTLINRSFMNMLEFQEAFECLPSDAMNPITKCMVNQCL